MARHLTRKDPDMTVYHVTIEAAADGPAPTAEELDALLEYLGPECTVFGSPEIGQPRYGYEGSFVAMDAISAANQAVEMFGKAISNTMLPEWPIVRIVTISDAELDAELERPTFPDLVGIREIAGLLSVTPQRASALCRKESFPAPVAELRSGPVWTAHSVRRFVDEWDRSPGRPRARAAS